MKRHDLGHDWAGVSWDNCCLTQLYTATIRAELDAVQVDLFWSFVTSTSQLLMSLLQKIYKLKCFAGNCIEQTQFIFFLHSFLYNLQLYIFIGWTFSFFYNIYNPEQVDFKLKRVPCNHIGVCLVHWSLWSSCLKIDIYLGNWSVPSENLPKYLHWTILAFIEFFSSAGLI